MTGRSDQARLRSGVPQLDTILNGGFIQSGTYALLGPAGSGKTILANQICSHHVAQDGGRCVYVSLLGESHARLIGHLESMHFFRREYVPDKLFYINGYQSLRADGLTGLLRLLRSAVQERDASILVVDGLETVRDIAANEREFREFLHQLQAFAGVANCTTFLISLAQPAAQESERALADGVLELTLTLAGVRAVRELTVSKFRGSAYLMGKHEVEISETGMTIYPRLEAEAAPATDVTAPPDLRLGFGIPGFDDLLGGGLPFGTTTALLGPPGIGKTLLGLSFLLDGARQGQPGVYFGLHESPSRLLATAAAAGLPLRQHVDDGAVRLVWQAPGETSIDALARGLLKAAAGLAAGPRRVFIDSAGGFRAAAAYPDRMVRFLPALFARLQHLQVTTVASAALPPLHEASSATAAEVAQASEGVLLLREVEVGRQIHRLMSVLKMQGSDSAALVRELRIGAAGIEVSDAPPITRTPAGAAEPQQQKAQPGDKASERGRR
jgi:circadian clock protein KaiC